METSRPKISPLPLKASYKKKQQNTLIWCFLPSKNAVFTALDRKWYHDSLPATYIIEVNRDDLDSLHLYVHLRKLLDQILGFSVSLRNTGKWREGGRPNMLILGLRPTAAAITLVNNLKTTTYKQYVYCSIAVVKKFSAATLWKILHCFKEVNLLEKEATMLWVLSYKETLWRAFWEAL